MNFVRHCEAAKQPKQSHNKIASSQTTLLAMTPILKILILFSLLFSLILLCTACGFKPQGQTTLAPPLHRMYLQTTDPYGTLSRNLQQSLKMSRVQLVSSAQEADTVLVIRSDTEAETLLSVSGTTQTRQYNLSVTVVFSIENANGITIVPPQTLTENRAITVQSNLILGSSNEANLFYQQMRRTLANAIMNRIASSEVTQMINANYQAPSRKHNGN